MAVTPTTNRLADPLALSIADPLGTPGTYRISPGQDTSGLTEGAGGFDDYVRQANLKAQQVLAGLKQAGAR